MGTFCQHISVPRTMHCFVRAGYGDHARAVMHVGRPARYGHLAACATPALLCTRATSLINGFTARHLRLANVPWSTRTCVTASCVHG